MTKNSRVLGELTSADISARLSETSILCLPLGATEQHGPHLPLNTDLIIAEAVTSALIARYGEPLDLWQLPSLPIGLSPEHAWAKGTISLSVDGLSTYLRDLGRSIEQS